MIVNNFLIYQSAFACTKLTFFNDTECSLLYHFTAAYGLFNYFNDSAIVHFISKSVLCN